MNVFEKLREWTQDETDLTNYTELRRRLELLDRLRYAQYEPTRYAMHAFVQRLGDCLDCIDDDADQRLLVQLIPHALFISREELETLYRAIMSGPVSRWLVDVLDIDLGAPNVATLVGDAIRETWFCPITDSMPIAQFYHINALTHSRLRPDFYSLRYFSGTDRAEKVLQYMTNNGLKRIVLIEDFVGTGNQMKGPVQFASELGEPIPVLVSPALACPESKKTFASLNLPSHVRYEPLVVLSRRAFLRPTRTEGEADMFHTFRSLVERLAELVAGGDSNDRDSAPFGFEDVGALVVLYTNCPNNTIALLRYESDTWKPVFPRSRRAS